MFIQLFYSTKCQACNELWTVIINEGLQRMFVPVCLDKMSPKSISELKLERIPAIIILSDGQRPIIYEGSNACGEWLNTIIKNRRINMKQYVETQRKLIHQRQLATKNSEQHAIEYVTEEMDGISDAYSYVATDLFQPKNYVPVGQEHNFNIVTPQDKEQKINNIETMSNVKELMRVRDKDAVDLQKMMEQQQIQTILNSQMTQVSIE